MARPNYDNEHLAALQDYYAEHRLIPSYSAISSLLGFRAKNAAAALVGFPDARLGERGCVYVVVKPGQTFDLPALQAYMAECKVAKQYWPEKVEVVAELPRTPSGKIQKFVLREKAKVFANT